MERFLLAFTVCGLWSWLRLMAFGWVCMSEGLGILRTEGVVGEVVRTMDSSNIEISQLLVQYFKTLNHCKNCFVK